MSGARDTELLNYIRSFGQTEASPPPCKFEHWGIMVTLSPKLAKQSEPPADHVVFAEFMEEMLPHCQAFRSTYPGTRAEDTHKVMQAFIDHFLTPSKDNPIPNFQRYGHKGRAQPYAIWFLKCFCNFLKERYPVARKATAVPSLPPRAAVYPFGPATPPPSSPATLAKVLPLQPSSPPAVPKSPTKKRPLPTGLNPFERPGEGWDAANFQPAHAEIKLSLNQGAKSADPKERRRAH